MVSKLTVLLADDDHLLRELLTKLLRENGFTIVEAESGEQALSLVAGARPDILVSDISMPGSIDGWKLAKACRSLFPELPVIYTSTSARNSAEMVEDSVFFQKPYRPYAVVAAVQHLTSRMLRES